MNIQEALHQLLDGKDLSGDDMVIVMEQIMTGAVSNSMIVGFLVALRMKGETVDEVAAAATVMRSLAEKVNLADESAIDMSALVVTRPRPLISLPAVPLWQPQRVSRWQSTGPVRYPVNPARQIYSKRQVSISV